MKGDYHMKTIFDATGTAIFLGDFVVFGLGGSMQLVGGEVVKVNAKTVIIKYFNPRRDRIDQAVRTFSNVVVNLNLVDDGCEEE
jgi:hypothetical protein